LSVASLPDLYSVSHHSLLIRDNVIIQWNYVIAR